MKITFLGADKIVTGSCHLLEVNGKKILLDCGMFQGPKLIRDLNRKPFSFNHAGYRRIVSDPAAGLRAHPGIRCGNRHPERAPGWEICRGTPVYGG